MMKLFNKTLPIALLLIASGCASSYKLPASKPFSPEAEGGNRGSIQVGARQFYKITVTTDNATMLVSNSAHNVETGQTVGFSGNYGVLQWMDLGISYDVSTFPLYYLKAQFLGKNKRAAEANSFSASLIMGFSLGKTQSETSSTSIFGSQTGTVELKSGMGFDAGLQCGYRTSKSILLTFGINGYWQKLDGSQLITPGNTSVTFSDHPRLLEINGGAIFYPEISPESNKTFLHPLIQYGRINTFGRDEYRFTYSVEIGYLF